MAGRPAARAGRCQPANAHPGATLSEHQRTGRCANGGARTDGHTDNADTYRTFGWRPGGTADRHLNTIASRGAQRHAVVHGNADADREPHSGPNSYADTCTTNSGAPVAHAGAAIADAGTPVTHAGTPVAHAGAADGDRYAAAVPARVADPRYLPGYAGHRDATTDSGGTDSHTDAVTDATTAESHTNAGKPTSGYP